LKQPVQRTVIGIIHLLRFLGHSCVSYLLGKGVPIHIVSAMLGHTRVSTTLDVYSHCLPTQQHNAVTAALGGALNFCSLWA
jgi:site-specific recombinase XerD